MDPALRFFRIFFSVVGYALRPAAVVGMLLVICPPKRRTWKIWILCLINLAVYSTAFWSPVAFSYDRNYAFVRGPLGYCAFLVALLYMVRVLLWTWERFYDGWDTERWILIICALSCIAAACIDAVYGGCRVNEAMMISSIFFYMFLRSHDNRLDPLTALDNRYSFYDDIRHRKGITAVASLDMNGLKQINDTQGHEAGDAAIAEVGRCLRRANRHDTTAYRVGGDEFVIVFVQQSEAIVARTLVKLKSSVTRSGYSISAGYAMVTDNESVEAALRESDQNMYKEKAAYYQQKGMDRRKRI